MLLNCHDARTQPYFIAIGCLKIAPLCKDHISSTQITAAVTQHSPFYYNHLRQV